MFTPFIVHSLFIPMMMQPLIIYSIEDKSYSSKEKYSVLNIGNSDDPRSLDPQICSDIYCMSIIWQLFEGLVKSDKNGTIIPASAKSWTISENNKIITFYLRENLKWSDGSKVTAHDFVYSFQRLVDPNTASDQSALLEIVVNGKEIIEGKKPKTSLGVRAIDDHTLEITLTQPSPTFFENLLIANTFPVQRENIQEFNDSFTQAGKLVSNGAFKLTSRKHNDKVTIERNPYYWNDKKTYLDKVNYITINDPTTQLAMYKTGQIDITSTIPVNQYQKLKKEYPSELVINLSLGSYFYIYNTLKPPLDNKKLRHALNIAIDRNALVYAVLNMDYLPLYDPIPYGVKGYTQNKTYWQDWPRKKQIEEAKKLYKEAGYSKKKPLNINITYNTSDLHKKIAIAIASMWKEELGVNVTIQNMEWKVLKSKRLSSDFEVMRLGYAADVNDAFDFLYHYRTNAPSNHAKYSNPKLDRILEQASVEIDSQKRKVLLENAGRIIMEDVPISTITTLPSYYLIKPYVKGFYIDSMGKFYLSGVYTEDSSAN